MTTMKTYTAVCRRSGDWWAISVPELKGVHTQAKRLDQVEGMTRDAIALFLDVPADTIAVDVQPEVPDEVHSAVEARRAAEVAERRAARATVEAIQVMLAAGLTVRDAGRILGISPQRVSQLTQAPGGRIRSTRAKAHRGERRGRALKRH